MAIIFEREKDLEDLLMEYQEFTGEQFGCENYLLFRQVNLGTYGIADIIAVESEWLPGGESSCEISIIELKNEPLTHVHISQVARYREFFRQFTHRFSYFSVRCHLVGPKTFPKGDDLCFLAQSIPWLQVYEFGFNPMSGLELTLVSGWKFTKENDAAVSRAWDLLDPGEKPVPIPHAANESTH